MNLAVSNHAHCADRAVHPSAVWESRIRNHCLRHSDSGRWDTTVLAQAESGGRFYPRHSFGTQEAPNAEVRGGECRCIPVNSALSSLQCADGKETCATWI